MIVVEDIKDAQVAAINQWQYFDAKWYLNEYPDVAWLGLDPAFHYLWIGARIGRRPSEGFTYFANHYQGTEDLLRRVASGDFTVTPAIGPRSAQPTEFVGPGGVDVAAVQGYSVAVHAHMYYPDLANEFVRYLSRMPCSFDLYVSTINEEACRFLVAAFSNIPKVNDIDVRAVPNIGRDIAPFVVEFGRDLAKYDLVSHIQTKKSLYNEGKTDGWREYILQSLFESPERISLFLRALNDGRYGIIYPQCFYNLPYMANTWLANAGIARVWAPRFGVKALPDGYFDFPAGSMFWAKAEAIRPLLEAGLTWDNFPPEEGQTDGTLAHCIERMLGVVPTSRSFQHGVIRDIQTPSWSRWRFNQFIDRPIEHLHSAISDSTVKIVAFDIFDTLITRPFLDADYVKHLLDAEYEREGIKGFRNLRIQKEGQARENSGRDVNIHDIYRHIAAAPGIAPIASTPQREIDLEIKSVRPRQEVVNLLNFAKKMGKKVVLASDMFLTRPAIETMLEHCGVHGWKTIYLSSEIGLRKDSGKLYEHILAEEKIEPYQMVMVGDNERSDFQIPADMGIQTIHVIKPAHIMRAMPRLADLIPDADKAPVADQFLFGAIAAENFGLISYPDFSSDNMFGSSARSIGYGLLGPMLTVFSQWLLGQARQHRLERFYFLAREGKLLKQAFDLWQEGRTDSVDSEYLLISRRAVTVPCISANNDIFHIAASNNFYGASMEMFLEERFGVVLDDSQWAECGRRKLWSRDDPLTIMNGNIEHIRPFLHFIAPRILEQAVREREIAVQYFTAAGLNDDQRAAVVDVGYGATIQRHLIKLLGRNIHGLYMMTDVKGASLKSGDRVLAEGCFEEGVERTSSAPPMFLNSFLLEKMLSTDDEQVIRYTASDSVEFRTHAEYIDQRQKFRNDMQQGALDFVKEAIRFREEIYGDLEITKEICRELFSSFVKEMSEKERVIFSSLSLDDFYCGRGIVSDN